jgi:hypothetical protein
MSYSELASEITSLRSEQVQLDAVLQARIAEEQTGLSRDRQSFAESEVRECQAARAAVERRLTLVRDRVAALERQLPTAERRARAQRDAASVLAEAQSYRSGFHEAWHRYLKHLEDAERIGCDLLHLRSEAQRTINSLNQLVAQFGLDIPVPPTPTADATDAKLAALVCVRLRAFAHGGDHDTAVRDLNALRKERSLARVS